ncbi:MAG TPA: sigma-54 dependent transcriptional regulator [Thermodesulfovibrionia bacterium]|nr:sigma-54 dependent transcriptional regulator [Thermodesulfovibrionia bacterium]
MEAKAKLLIIDDEKIALKNLEHIMTREGYEVTCAQSGVTAVKLLEKEQYDVVLTDLKMEKVDGIQILKKCKELYPDSEVIIITAYASLESAVNAVKTGAFYYISKPFRFDEVRKVVKEAWEKVQLKRENKQLREQIELYTDSVKIITHDANMLKILDTAKQIAPTDCNVIISGQSGTGKELFAKYIHYNSKRKNGPFLAINCSTFSDELLTNELFGHEKGAFTGAISTKKGLIEMAFGGTLFLDEVTEMPPSMQVKLLRVIQEKEFIRVGGTKTIETDVRLIAATNRDINEAIENRDFRQDLFFRLNVVSLNIPPLSERIQDIPLLCHYFLRKYSIIMKKDVREISKEVMDILKSYDFPGNVRELANIIERGVALATDKSIELCHIPEELRELEIRQFKKKDGKIPTLEDQEIAYIKWVLNEVDGNKSAASQLLGINRASLWRKIKQYNLELDK